MVNSMTAFASKIGSLDDQSWAWEIRSVNGRGLDIKIRLPEGFEAFEPVVRKQISAHCKRGTISVGMRLKRSAVARTAQLNAAALDRALDAAQAVKAAAKAANLTAGPIDIATILSLPGVFAVSDNRQDEGAVVQKQMAADLAEAVDGFVQARGAEGAALEAILLDQIEEIAKLCDAAGKTLDGRRGYVEQTMRSNIARVLDNTEALDEGRVAQELAIIAVKADVAEELDRLSAHVSAARDLIGTKGPIGRKFDFLTQEFNREANTLCSKANYTELTNIGLDLKTVIDQMREQVQNVE